MAPFVLNRRSLRANDVAMEILYCGVCHSDLHTARNDWGWTVYPALPGHEIVGRVTAVGADVTRYKVGDTVAVGCMVDSCIQCDQCRKGEEQLCREGNTNTYNGQDRVTKENTYGDYSATRRTTHARRKKRGLTPGSGTGFRRHDCPRACALHQ
jgi:uncharacterized zinc-type alcohol dehydrogenase-like protein